MGAIAVSRLVKRAKVEREEEPEGEREIDRKPDRLEKICSFRGLAVLIYDSVGK